MKFKSFDRPYKNIYREVILPRNRPETSVWLCGPEMIDFKCAIDKDLLPQGNHIVVEKDPASIRMIRDTIPTLNVKPTLFPRDLSKLKCPYVNYVNMDLTGSFTLSLATWLSNLSVVDDGELCITMQLHHTRGNEFMPLCEKLLSHLPIFHAYCPPHHQYKMAIGLHQTVLGCLLRRYQCDGYAMGPYKDHHFKMMVYRLTNFRKSDKCEIHPDLITLVRDNLPSGYLDDPGQIHADKVQQIVHKIQRITRIKNHRKKWDKVRGVNREITVYGRTPSFVAAIKKAMLEANIDYSLLIKNILKTTLEDVPTPSRRLPHPAQNPGP